MQKEVDYLIIGQGLAGSILALQLIKENKSFHIYDPSISNSSTVVAAGLINPMVLKRLTLSWKAKEFINYNNQFYPEVEKVIQENFYHPTAFYKLIISEDEKYFWDHRFKKKKFIEFMDRNLISAEDEIHPTEDFLKGKIKHAGWIDTKLFLESFRNILLKEEKLTEEKIDYQKLKPNNYQNINFKNLVFCEGIAANKNPFFKDFKLIGNKGNVLTIHSDEFNTTDILCKKVFVLPIGDNHYKIGSTYDIHYKDDKPDEDKKELMQSQFEEMSTANYTITEHRAAIRPTVEDRRPLLGRIKEQENYYVFNGLGSRGCLMAPLLAKELVDFMEKNQPLTNECNIDRFYN